MADDLAWYSIKTEGFKELEEVLIQMGEEFGYDKPADKVLKPALLSAVEPVRIKLYQTIPYDDDPNRKPGPHMRDTIRSLARRPSARDKRSNYVDQNDAMLGIVEIRTDKRGVSQEFGNARTPAQPYLRVALESQIDASLARFRGWITVAIKKYKSKKV